MDVKLTTPEPRTIEIAWRKPARAELPDHLLYEFVFKWIPQGTEFLITFDPRKAKGGLVYRHKTDKDYQQVEVSITACSEGVEGIGGGCSEAVKVKGITWPGSAFTGFWLLLLLHKYLTVGTTSTKLRSL